MVLTPLRTALPMSPRVWLDLGRMKHHTDGPEPITSVPAHYEAMTDSMLKYGGGELLACHFGLWEAETKSGPEALRHSNRTLVEGCDLGPGRRVLDAGCGVGGTAIALAETCGAHVTGLTNCEPHVAVATEQAKRRGVGHLVEFHHGDFMYLPFPNACFDAVVNHEAFCYAPDKLAYLRGVFRVLKPGGRWQALEGLLSGEPLSEADEATHTRMQWGFRMPPLVSWRDVLATLEKAGFEGIREQDLTSKVSPYTERVRKFWSLYSFVTPIPSGPERAYHEFMEAAIAFDQGLREGVFTYRFVSGAKPNQAF